MPITLLMPLHSFVHIGDHTTTTAAMLVWHHSRSVNTKKGMQNTIPCRLYRHCTHQNDLKRGGGGGVHGDFSLVVEPEMPQYLSERRRGGPGTKLHRPSCWHSPTKSAGLPDPHDLEMNTLTQSLILCLLVVYPPWHLQSEWPRDWVVHASR